MSQNQELQGYVDAHGISRSVEGAADEQFAIAHLQRSAVVSHSSLSIEDDSRVVAGTCGHAFLLADGGPRRSAIAADAMIQKLLGRLAWPRPEDASGDDPGPVEILPQLNAIHGECKAQVQRLAFTPSREASQVALSCVFWPDLYFRLDSAMQGHILRNDTVVRLTPGESGHIQLQLDDTLVLSECLMEHLQAEDLRDAVNCSDTARDTCNELIRRARTADDVVVLVATFRSRDADAERVAEQKTRSVADALREPKPRREAPQVLQSIDHPDVNVR